MDLESLASLGEFVGGLAVLVTLAYQSRQNRLLLEQATGQQAASMLRANYLFDRTLEYFKTLHRTRGAPFGILDVQIHAIRAENDKAIAALREAYDMGW